MRRQWIIITKSKYWVKVILIKLTAEFLLKLDSRETNAEVQKLKPSWTVQGTLHDFAMFAWHVN